MATKFVLEGVMMKAFVAMVTCATLLWAGTAQATTLVAQHRCERAKLKAQGRVGELPEEERGGRHRRQG